MIHPGGTIGRLAHRKLLAAGAALVIVAGLAACEDRQQSPGSLVGDLDTRDLVEGVTYREFIDDQSGALVHLLEVDLASPGVAVEAVTPGMVSEAEQPTVMAQAAGATAVVNGDFFNNRSDRHPLAEHTYAPVGPLVIGGEELSAAVPAAQRMGPSRPDDPENEAVLAFTADGRAVVTSLALEGTVRVNGAEVPLDGLNQYAIREGTVGAFTDAWGWGTRMRSVCGLDDDRRGPCSESARELTVVDATVTEVADFAGGRGALVDAIGEGETIFVARDGAAAHFDGVAVGDVVTWDYELVEPDGATVVTAIGGQPLLINGAPQNRPADEGPDDRDARTAAGHSEDGGTLYLAVLDGANLGETARILSDQGATSVINLDGGGSSVMGLAGPDGDVTPVNDTFDVTGERAVANALLVLTGSVADERLAPAGVDDLVGVWQVVATSPGQSSTLTVEADGTARYTSEGTLVDYYEGTAVPVDGAQDVFAIDFEAFGDLEADPEEYAFSVEVAITEDPDVLGFTWDGYEQTYTRSR